MSIPYHKPGCTSKAYKTRCSKCGADVFYFSCNCGTRVFFDELGQPWGIHNCKKRREREHQAPKSVRRVKNIEPKSDNVEVVGRIVRMDDVVNNHEGLGTKSADPMTWQLTHIVIQTNADKGNVCLQYHAFASNRRLKIAKASVGKSIIGLLSPQRNSDGAFWMLEDFKIR